MPFAFVVRPVGMPTRAAMFLHAEFSLISQFKPEDLQSMAKDMFSDDYNLEDFEFFEVGKYMPITFDRQVSWTMNHGYPD